MKNLNVYGLVLVVYVICGNSLVSCSSSQKLVIDNDAGADDAMAIFIASLSEKHLNGPQLVALTTGNGNTIEDNVYRNNQRILKVAKRQDIPIYRGTKSSLVTTPVTSDYYGADGLGDVETDDTGLVPAKEKNGVLALIELSQTYEGELVVITIGTLTNIALAIKLDPNFLSRLAHLYVGASNIHSETETEAEFNARMDADAYHILAQHATPDKVTVFPFSQAKLFLNFTKEWREQKLGIINNDYINALNLYERVSIQRSPFWQQLDPATISIFLMPSLVSEYKYPKHDIVLCGDKRGFNTNEFVEKEDANVRMVYSVRREEYEQFLLDIFDLNQYKTGKEIGNEFSNRSINQRRTPKSKTPAIFTRISIRLRRSLSRLLKQKQPDFKTQSEAFEGSMICFIFFGRCLGIFPFMPPGRQKYPILSRGYIIPIIISMAQLIVAIFIFIGTMYTSINLSRIFHLSYYGLSFFCSVLVIRLATKWHDLINQIEVADLNDYIDPSVKFKCILATVAFISFGFMHNVLSVTSKLVVVLDCNSSNVTFYGKYILTAYDWFFDIDVPYSVPFGIMLIVLNMIATINLIYYQVFVMCLSMYLQSILEKIHLKINSINFEYLSESYWRALRQDYSRATQLVRSLDDIVNGLVFTLFATNLYFVCLQVLYVFSKDGEIRLLHDYAQITSITYNVYSTIHIIVNFFSVSLIIAKVHSSSLKVAPLLYSVPPQTYCTEVQRFIEQIQGDPVALTGLNFFYVTKDVILTMVGAIFTYELVLLQLN